MEELSAVGEQVFDAECILNKRVRKGKLEFLVKWRGWSSNSHPAFSSIREQEKELLMLKRGKRPRGRPRKILVRRTSRRAAPPFPDSDRTNARLFSTIQDNLPEPPKSSTSSSAMSSSSDSSSSCSSSSSSSEDEDEDEDSHLQQTAPTVRTRDHDPVPQKKAQILMAKPDPSKKRRGEAKELQQNKAPPKTDKGPDLPGGPHKPVQPHGFAFLGFHRGSTREAVGAQNRSPLAQGGGVKNAPGSAGPGRSSVQTSLPLNKSAQSRPSAMSSGANLDLKKAKGVAALHLNPSKHPLQGAAQHTPGGQRKAHTPLSTMQRMLSAKTGTPPPKNPPSNPVSGPQPLNLQHKLSQGSGTAGNAQRGAATPAKKAATPAQVHHDDPQRRPAARKTQPDKSGSEVQKQPERSKKPRMTEMSTGEEESSSDSDHDASFNGAAVQNQDWKPTRSLIEHVFVTDVTANLVTVTVKESPTSVGFFSLRNY
uniref:Chromobox homolog 2 (Drosophila Pc class) n=1 Tax=Oryzias sinensis TaxID=183150 RepID=A0A8C7YMI7_9TELE